ncbi:MAG: hypothetical protein AAFY47_07930 [Pseudomonadota bacterium]
MPRPAQVIGDARTIPPAAPDALFVEKTLSKRFVPRTAGGSNAAERALRIQLSS